MERISDFFALFIEKATNVLKDKGFLGYIVPSTLMMNLSFTKLRKLLLEKTSLTNLAHLGDGVFEGAVVPTCVVAFSKTLPQDNLIRAVSGNRNPYAENVQTVVLEQTIFLSLENYIFNISSNQETLAILTKAKSLSIELTNLVDIKEGVKTGNDKIFLSKIPFETNSFPLVKGRNIERYNCQPVLFINYDQSKLSRSQKPEHFLVDEKLFVRRVGDSLIASYDNKKLFCVHTLYTVRKRPTLQNYSLKFLLGIINSKLMNFYYHQTSIKKGSVFPEVRIYSLNQLPIRTINFADKNEKAMHDKMVALVEQMLEAKKHLQTARTDKDKNYYQDRCNSLDRQIDKLVYELYDLTVEEIKIVEGK
jgi:hypothetical protein